LLKKQIQKLWGSSKNPEHDFAGKFTGGTKRPSSNMIKRPDLRPKKGEAEKLCRSVKRSGNLAPGHRRDTKGGRSFVRPIIKLTVKV